MKYLKQYEREQIICITLEYLYCILPSRLGAGAVEYTEWLCKTSPQRVSWIWH